MLRVLCCCFSSEDSETERQPLLQPTPSALIEGGSARQTLPSHRAQNVSRTGRLVMRRVCVPDLDKRFSDMAETFNEQQECYEAMVRHIGNLQHTYGCGHSDTLYFSECLGKIRKEHDASYRISLKMKGYDFYLTVVPVGLEDESEQKMLPPCLRTAQSELRGTCERAKATISKGTTLQELIGWLLRSRDQMTDQVNEAAPSYQERGRLTENLEENMREVRRAKDLSMKYRRQAGEVFTEAAQIAGDYV